MHAIIGDDRVTQYLSFDSRTMRQSVDMINGIKERATIEPRAEYYLAVVLDGDRLAGFVRLGLGGVRAAKLGYATNANHWGKGYATDASRTIIAFGFSRLNLHRITAAIGPSSAASIAVATKLGLQYEGRLRDHVFTNGEWRDSLLYAKKIETDDDSREIQDL